VVGELLGAAPVQVFEVGLYDLLFDGAVGQLDGEFDVVGLVLFLVEVLEGGWVLCWEGDFGVLQGLEGDDPGGDCGDAVLGREWAQRNVLPRLEVTV
jgi:hypothetical protein